MEQAKVNYDSYSYLVAFLSLLNSADLAFTLFFMDSGIEEANPILNYVIQNWGIDGFVVVKSFIGVTVPSFLFLVREKLLARLAAWIVVIPYIFVVCYHAYYFFVIG